MSSIAEENGGFFRKNAGAITKYLEIAVQMISDISDDASWEQGVFGDEDELSEDNSSPHVAGIMVGVERKCEVDGGQPRGCAARRGVQARHAADDAVQPVGELEDPPRDVRADLPHRGRLQEAGGGESAVDYDDDAERTERRSGCWARLTRSASARCVRGVAGDRLRVGGAAGDVPEEVRRAGAAERAAAGAEEPVPARAGDRGVLRGTVLLVRHDQQEDLQERAGAADAVDVQSVLGEVAVRGGADAQHAVGAVGGDLCDRQSVQSDEGGLRAVLPHHHSGLARHSGLGGDDGDDERARGGVRVLV